MTAYIELLKAAQLATTREEAQKILDVIKSLDLIENSYQLQPISQAAK